MVQVLCKLDDIDAAAGREVVVEGPEGRVYLALLVSGRKVHAWLSVCPHQGRSLSWAPGEFLFGDAGELVCPHHGACFDPATGECVSGPCQGDFLTPVEVLVKDGEVLLDSDRLRTPG